MKEYWGEGSERARNWPRYGHGEQALAFEEGVDGLVPYTGDVGAGLAATMAKLRSTMVSCGSRTLAEFRATPRLTIVSAQSAAEGAATVIVRERSSDRPAASAAAASNDQWRSRRPRSRREAWPGLPGRAIQGGTPTTSVGQPGALLL